VCEIPQILTPRLKLRAHTKDDLHACLALWQDPEVFRHITRQPSTQEECWARILRYHGHWHWFGFGFWLMEERATGRPIGEIGLADFRRAIEPSLDGRPEMGWAITTDMHGKGLGTEAAQAVASWGDKSLVATKTACIIAPENRASICVAQKIGFVKHHQTTYKGDNILVFHRG
jgi:RimJ/RimL family protein N-acetyltransferase